MKIEIMKVLLNNSSFLLMLSMLNMIRNQLVRSKKCSILIEGVVTGLICISLMLNSFELSQGLVFDTRSILLSLSVLFFHKYSTIIAGFIAVIFRIYLGGVGVVMGVSVISVVIIFGFIWKKYIFRIFIKSRNLELYLYGIYIHVLMLLCMFVLPSNLALEAFKELAVIIIILYPLVTLLLGIFIFFVNDRRIIEERIREDEAVYRGMFENNHAVILLIDPENGQIKDVNLAACEFYGYNKKELIEMNINQINTLSNEEIKTEMNKAFRLEKNYFEFKHKKSNGDVVNVESYSGTINRKGKKLLYSIVHDVTSKNKFQNSLIERDRLLNNIFDYSPYGIFVLIEEKFWLLNSTACKLFGVNDKNEILNDYIYSYFIQDTQLIIKNRLSTISSSNTLLEPIEYKLIQKNGTEKYIEVVTTLYEFDNKQGTISFAKDITDNVLINQIKDQIEQKSQQQQKLESLGLLAGGVAHEINNPLNGIMNYAELILDVSSNFEVKNYSKEIISETLRISEIVKSLLQFSRMDKKTHSFARIEDIVNSTLVLVKTIYRNENISLIVNFEDNLPQLICRSQQIQQVLMNMLTNSRDALNEKYSLSDKSKEIRLNVYSKFQNEKLWIVTSIRDNGNGISQEIIQKIFEPFYSTKPKDRGTGLGLSISFGIIQDHNGFIEVDSTINEYTEFKIYLPVLEEKDG